jgi:cyclic pyranopterin phosphate synthase
LERAESLKEAGLQRVTVSLDSLRNDRFFEITRNPDLNKIIRGINAAKMQNLTPVKINCVIVKGLNDDEIVDFVKFARKTELMVRFIEFMPLDEDEKWSRDKVVTGAEILKIIQAEFDLVKIKPVNKSQTASNFGFRDSKGGIGLVTTVSDPFCGGCSRIRLTADGKLRNCLFASNEFSIKSMLRDGSTDHEVENRIREIISLKEQGHRINEPDFSSPPRTMSYIGG